MRHFSVPYGALALLFIMLGVGSARGARPTWLSAKPGALELAHVDFLVADWKAMVAHARDALVEAPNDRDVLENVRALFDAAYARAGALPADWKLPEEIGFLKASVIRVGSKTEAQGRALEEYAIQLLGEPAASVNLKQVQLVRFPDEVVLDKQGAIGTWGETKDGSRRWFHLERNFRAAPMPGLYLLNLEIEGKKNVQGWFLLGGPSTGALPVPLIPADKRPVSSGFPRLEWSDYQSAHYRAFEKRKVLVSVMRPRQMFENALWFALLDAPADNVRYGLASYGAGARRGLAQGDYWLYLAYVESRKFGGMLLARETGITMPFRVAK